MLKGALAAAVTPLQDAGEALDEAAFGPYVQFLAAGGVDGLLALGTTGEGFLLELPAGKLDEEGESPLDTGKRELAEEIGKGAGNWRHLTTCYTSPGFTDEQVHVYLATDLYDERAESGENERIEVKKVPLRELDSAIEACHDAKSLIGLLWLKAYENPAA